MSALQRNLSLLQARTTEYFPRLWPAVEAGLATCATLVLPDQTNPVTLIYVGESSTGKTTVAQMFDKLKTADGTSLTYRSDKFTPASFVSHSAKATSTQLASIDLLPKIQDKVFLTPELAPIFRGKPDDLTERFSIITRVLDGQGLTTDSGTHGQRGYEGTYLFAWLGCTTPLKDKQVWDVMGQLGSRLFFFTLETAAATTTDELMQAMEHPGRYKRGLEECQDAVCQVVEALFASPKRDVAWKMNREVRKEIAHCAELLAIMRTPADGKNDTPPQPEAPTRAAAVLGALARGRALVHDRNTVLHDDLPFIVHVMLSTMPHDRRTILLAMAMKDGAPLTVEQVSTATGISRHTAESRMAELDWLGLMTFNQAGMGKTARLSIHEKWAWVMAPQFRKLLMPPPTWQKSGGV